ncbi:ABC transporter substrate-binding protein [Microbacterium dextranolyticum]|uniref:Iron ABC transporter substrate-binding protein n=1 Tax=Microbacterium dextranolyticum TaxID=36806 RepID=A0A9W6HMR5_9MICO|nr:iron-siderophore ABC transporter substrate-binding protein [Microbacterium dextranolyticum]MBM7463320.1 iron complex transport system substrate-binding protein [Microbacterium dextranolyticum]GLJ95576.1 iron ABC transporter substrate-binding protein [Microbacterium dextranolyticum]
MRPPAPRRALTLIAAVAALGVILTGCSAASRPDATTSMSAASAGTHAVEHARGTTEVPDSPQRVVVLEPVELDTAVALGVTPVGAALPANVGGVPAYLGVSGVQSVGTVAEPDLEAIASLRPDLILGTEARHSKLYDQLSAIAPTVFMKTQADPWQRNVALIGDALGHRTQAMALVDDFNSRCARIASEYPVAGKTANFVRPLSETSLRIYSPTSFAGSALACVGLTIPAQPWDGDGGIGRDISPENILDAKADYVFVSSIDPADATTTPPAITRNAGEFPSLTLVDTSYWLSGVGPKGGELVLDDIEKFLAAHR